MTHPKWTRDLFCDEDLDEAGLRISDFSRAIMLYVGMQQGRDVSVAELIRVFNTDRASVLDAIEAGAWIFLTGPDDDDTKRIVELEGE